MKSIKSNLSKVLILKFLILNLILPINLFSMEPKTQKKDQGSSQELIEDLSDKAKILFGIFESEIQVDFNNFDLDDYTTKVRIGLWNKLISRTVEFVNSVDNQYLKCFIKNSIDEARCDSGLSGPKKQILTIYDLNQGVFGALYDLNSIAKTEGITSYKINIKLLSRLKDLDNDIKNIRESLKNSKISKDKKDLDVKSVIEHLIKIYEEVADKIRKDFSPDKNKLIEDIEVAYKTVFVKQNMANGFNNNLTNLWNDLLLKVQRLAFASGVEVLACASQIQKNRCKNKENNIYNIYDLSSTIILGANEISKMYLGRDKNTYTKIKSVIDDSQEIIKQIRKNIDQAKISKKPIEQDAKNVLLIFLKKFEDINQKFKADFAGNKQSLMQEIKIIFNSIFGGDLVTVLNDTNQKDDQDKFDKLLFKIRLFVQFSGSEDLPKLLEEIEKNLRTVFEKMYYVNKNKADWDKNKSEDGLVFFSNSVYNPLMEYVTNARDLVKRVTTFRTGPSDAKEVLLTLIDKMNFVVEKYKQDWESYLTGKLKIKNIDKESMIKDIDYKISLIFKDDLSVYKSDEAEKLNLKIWDELLSKISEFIKSSNCLDCIKIYEGKLYTQTNTGKSFSKDNIKKLLNSIFETISLAKGQKNDFSNPQMIASQSPLQYFDDNLYKPVSEKLADAKKLVADLSVSSELGPKSAKSVLEYMLKNMDKVVKKFKSDWEKYLKSIKK